MFDAAIDGTFRALYVQGEDIAQSDPNTQHVTAALRAMDLVVVQDLFLNETAKFAHVFLPGTSFLEKDGTFTNAERRINRVRPVMAPKTGKQEWEIVCEIAQAMGYPMTYETTSQIMDEIALVTPTFSGVSFDKLDELGSIQWPCNDAAPTGTPIMHEDGFVRGKGRFIETAFVPTEERSTRKFPLILTTGRILSQYNVGAQTRRTENVRVAHARTSWRSTPTTPKFAASTTATSSRSAAESARPALRAVIADRMPVGVVYTTFHYPVTGANVVTTEHSDWATNCPEYKVTAVQVGLKQAANAASRAPVPAVRTPALAD